MSAPGLKPAALIAATTKSSASRVEARFGAKPPSSPTAVLWPAALSALFSAWKISGALAQGFREIWCADRSDHEFLEVDGVVGMRPAIQDVHHGHGQQRCLRRRRDSGRAADRWSRAAALAVASDTPRMALAPSRFLLSVPSSSQRRRSMPRWSLHQNRSARCGSRH